MKSTYKYSWIIAVAVIVCPEHGQADNARVLGDRVKTDRPPREQTGFDMRSFRTRLHNALELSDDQVAQLKELRAQLQVRLGDTREEVRQGHLTSNERRVMVQRIMNATSVSVGYSTRKPLRPC